MLNKSATVGYAKKEQEPIVMTVGVPDIEHLACAYMGYSTTLYYKGGSLSKIPYWGTPEQKLIDFYGDHMDSAITVVNFAKAPGVKITILNIETGKTIVCPGNKNNNIDRDDFNFYGHYSGDKMSFLFTPPYRLSIGKTKKIRLYARRVG